MGKATNRVPKQPSSKNEKMERLTWPLLPSLYSCSAAPKHLASICRLRTKAKDGPWYFGMVLQRRMGKKEKKGMAAFVGAACPCKQGELFSQALFFTGSSSWTWWQRHLPVLLNTH